MTDAAQLVSKVLVLDSDRRRADAIKAVCEARGPMPLFAFNLSWTPDRFTEHVPSVESLFASGELELF